MTASVKVGSFNTGTGAVSSTIAVTGVGFQPKVVFLWFTGRSDSSDAIGRADILRGFGVAISTTDRRAIASFSDDAAADSATGRTASTVACLVTVNAADTQDGALDHQSMDSDGFTLVVDDQLPADLRVSYLALGGDSLTNYVTGGITEPGATGNQDYTVSGSFQPDCVLFFSISHTANAGAGGSMFMLGAATASGAQAVLSNTSRDAVASTTTRMYCTNDECVALMASTASTTGRAAFVQFNSDGFRLNWTERAASRLIHYIALKGGNFLVGDLLTRTDGNDIAETGFGFQPAGAMFVSHGTTESTSDTAQNHDRLSLGAFDSTSSRNVQGNLDENNLTDSEATTAIEFDAVYVNIKTDSTIDGLMDIKSVESDGFTTVMDDVDPSQAFVWYLAFGPAAVAGGLVPIGDMGGNFNRGLKGGFVN